MTPNEVAKRFAYRPGYRLVDFQQVALPLYRVHFEALTLVKTPLAAIEEFVMRAVDAGLRSKEEIAGFLGLDNSIVVKTLAALAGTDQIALVGTGDDGRHVRELTSKGKQTLATATAVVPRREVLDVLFDGILRRPAYLPRVSLLRPRDVRAFGLRELPPLPKTVPELEELAAQDTERVIVASASRREPQRRILSLVRLVKRTRVFREATILVYKAETGEDVQVGFAVDGRLHPELENAFAQHGGVSRLKIAEQIGNSRHEAIEAFESIGEKDSFVKASIAAKQIKESVRPAIIAINEIEERRAQAEISLSQELDRREVEALKLRIEKLDGEHKQYKRQLTDIPVRFLEVFEHRPLFEHTVQTATSRVAIISPWITASVVNSRRLKDMQTLLERGVRLYVGYGIAEEQDKRARKEDIEAENKLKKLSERFDNFTFVRLGDTHAKVLLKDREFYVLGSFNWLSYEGDPKRPFREELSSFVAIPEKVDEFFERKLKPRLGI